MAPDDSVSDATALGLVAYDRYLAQLGRNGVDVK